MENLLCWKYLQPKFLKTQKFKNTNKQIEVQTKQTQNQHSQAQDAGAPSGTEFAGSGAAENVFLHETDYLQAQD